MLEQIKSRIEQSGGTFFGAAAIDGEGLRVISGVPSSVCHNSYSVAKVFTVTAIGMLCDAHLLSVTDRIYDILRPFFPERFDEKWTQVTVEDALLHKMGFTAGFLDIDAENPAAWGTKDYLSYCLSREIDGVPGETCAYSDAAYYILSRVVSRITGENMCGFLVPRLFCALDFREVAWSVCPLGYSMGATGLYISTADMAKLGRVYIDGGMYGKKSIVSSEWTQQVLSRGYELRQRKPGTGYCKGGMYGQQLAVSIEKNISVAWHSFSLSCPAGEILDTIGL